MAAGSDCPTDSYRSSLPKLRRIQRRTDALAADITNRHPDAAAGERQEIVEVASDRHGRLVVHGEAVAAGLGRPRRQEALLHLAREHHVALDQLLVEQPGVHARVSDRDRNGAGDSRDETQVRARELPRGRTVLDQQHAEGLPGRYHWRADHGSQLERADRFRRRVAPIGLRIDEQQCFPAAVGVLHDRAAHFDVRQRPSARPGGAGHQFAPRVVLQEKHRALDLRQRREHLVEHEPEEPFQSNTSALRRPSAFRKERRRVKTRRASSKSRPGEGIGRGVLRRQRRYHTLMVLRSIR